MDDLLIIQDKQSIENYIHPENIIYTFYHWKELAKEEKQKLIATYIDDIELTRNGDRIEIKSVNVRKTFYQDLIEYHKKHDTPLDIYLFVDDDDYRIPMAQGSIKTRHEVKEYFNKLKELYDVIIMKLYLIKI